MEENMSNPPLNALAIAICALSLTAPVMAPAMANDRNDRPTANDISMDEARDAVEDAGYTSIRAVEFDDGKWEVDAQDKDGRDVDVTVDASTGKVIKVDR
jgi:uncharacterized membrane protein YkoI